MAPVVPYALMWSPVQRDNGVTRPLHWPAWPCAGSQVLCWRKGQGSRVHNHARSHGWVTVLGGRVEEIR